MPACLSPCQPPQSPAAPKNPHTRPSSSAASTGSSSTSHWLYASLSPAAVAVSIPAGIPPPVRPPSALQALAKLACCSLSHAAPGQQLARASASTSRAWLQASKASKRDAAVSASSCSAARCGGAASHCRSSATATTDSSSDTSSCARASDREAQKDVSMSPSHGAGARQPSFARAESVS
ncbi:hypothetical protein Vretifemale_4913, partial [Volvox reticuliferus]